MIPRLARLVLPLLCAAALLSSALAENPRVSLTVEDVNAADAAAALTRASGIEVRIARPLPRPGVPAPLVVPALEERSSFDWNATTFARALRELCERYRLAPRKRPGGYVLRPTEIAPPPPLPPLGVVEKEGVRLTVARIEVGPERASEGPASRRVLQVEFEARLADGAAETIVGIENVRAKDSLGALIEAEGESSYPARPYPDEWAQVVPLRGYDPRATGLAWIEGDLLGHRVFERHVVEVPLRRRRGRREVGGAVVEVSPLKELPAEDPDAADGQALQIRVRVFIPAGGEEGAEAGSVTVPVLVGESGRQYQPASAASSLQPAPEGATYELSAEYRGLQEPAVKALVTWVEKSPPERLFSFRMTNLRIPARTAPPVTPVVRKPPVVRRVARPKPLATLVSPIIGPVRPPLSGSVSLGLALKEGATWGSVRWVDALVTGNGLVRVPRIKPGVYRVLRAFRPRYGSVSPGRGEWANSVTVLHVPPGKTTRMPPLQWKPSPALRPPPRPARRSGRPRTRR
ncbi:MAG TPA: hypothetical protein VK689_02540 [Armatimonadota bacterium]|nr:hypothetical protein [Armatimonadota bacterium]